jgi:phosphoserine phosphatase
MSTLPPTPAENSARIEALVRPLASQCRRRAVFLVDGDRTLSVDDTSRDFLERAGIDPAEIKWRFQRDGYCFEAFRFHAEVHLALGVEVFARLAPEVARGAALHPHAMDFLRLAAREAAVFVVSAGIPRVWRAVLDQHGLPSVGVIGGIDPATPFVLGRAEKAVVARLFLEEATVVIGVGDSDVDTEMLCLAHHAVVVVNHRQNEDLVPHLVGHPSLWQVVPRGIPHQGVPVRDFLSLHELAQARAQEAPPCL